MVAVLGIAMCTLILGSLFSFAWLIVGAIMFWGHLDKTDRCDDGLSAYMYVLLILSFVSIICNCSNGRKQ